MQQFIANDVLTVKLRYKQPQGRTSQLLSQVLNGAAGPLAQASADFRFAAAVAQFGLLLRQSPQAGGATWAATAALAAGSRAPTPTVTAPSWCASWAWPRA
ncbi:YfbK domain-containing protein [Hymenobacter coccineus]|uniref:YfbK domain-containing protein n=1 Tax=Hymenobacter coccineus TaxID=1908235 RepID=UPI000A723D69|nr:YfbK domain-containing protein [Hymenobacter coccineus]